MEQSSASTLSRALGVALPVAAVAVVALAFLLPPEWAPDRMASFVAGACWAAWMIWVWPQITLRADEIVVRNFVSTWHVPWGAVGAVQGGRGLRIALRDGRRINVAAVSAGEAMTEAWREGALGAEGGYFDGDARGESPLAPRVRTEADSWAREIAVRLRSVAADPAAAASRRPNVVPLVLGALAVAAVIRAILLS